MGFYIENFANRKMLLLWIGLGHIKLQVIKFKIIKHEIRNILHDLSLLCLITQ